MRRAVLAAMLAAAGCEAAAKPQPVVAAAPAPRLENEALDGLKVQLGELGYRVEAAPPSTGPDAIVASLDQHAWSLSLRVESSKTDRGPKVLVRVSVFSEGSHELRGEVAPYAIAIVGDPARRDDSLMTSLANTLGRRAAEQFAENFRP